MELTRKAKVGYHWFKWWPNFGKLGSIWNWPYMHFIDSIQIKNVNENNVDSLDTFYKSKINVLSFLLNLIQKITSPTGYKKWSIWAKYCAQKNPFECVLTLKNFLYKKRIQTNKGWTKKKSNTKNLFVGVWQTWIEWKYHC